MKGNEAYQRLIDHGIKPSAQRVEIMRYIMEHHTHPTVEDVYCGLSTQMPTLSRTTVYNTLRMFAMHNAAQMLTIDDHHICYDGNTNPHVHFYCRICGRVIDMMEEKSPVLSGPKMIDGNLVDEAQLYYKGICAECQKKGNIQ